MLRVVVIVSLIAVALALVSFLPPQVRLPVWIALIFVVVLPWWNFQDHAHLTRVAWVPFGPEFLTAGDVVGNVMLYAPFGYWLSQRWREMSSGWLAVLAAGALLSVATEMSQLYSHGRFPSATDVMTNLVGCGVGAWLAVW